MPELIAEVNAPRATTHRVVVLDGGAPAARLLELARCSTPRGMELEVFRLGVDGVTERADIESAEDSVVMEQPSVRSVLKTLHETRADALVLGYPDHAAGRSAFTDVVERATAAASVDVVVCVNRHERPWRRVLVPYLFGPLDSGALGVGRRLARSGEADVTVLHVVERASTDDGDQHLSASTDGCTLKVVTADDPITAAAAEARLGYDLIVLGGRESRPGSGRYFSMRQQRLLLATDATLAIVHSGRPSV